MDQPAPVLRPRDRLLGAVDLVATMVFALEGALAGIVAGLDVLGVVVLGAVTATGGGIIRDLLIGDIPPASIRRPRYVASAVAAGVVAIALQALVDDIPSWLLTGLDAAGLSLFAVAGTVKALDFELSAGMAAVMGTITGVGGGSLRDVLLGRVPAVLRVDVYATAALLGATVVVLTVRRWPPRWLMMTIGAAVCFTVRIAAVAADWDLPVPGD